MTNKHRMKRWLFLAVLFVVSISMQKISSQAKYATSGKMNSGAIIWELDTETGVMTVSGTGDMEGYNRDDNVYKHWDASLVKKVVIEEGITGIGKYEFSQHANLESVTIPSTLRSIGENAFYGSKNVTKLSLPEGMTELGDAALRGMSGLTKIEFPSTLTTIGKNAFTNCDALTEISIPDSVMTIGGYAFSGCDNLTKVHLPTSLKTVSTYLFGGDDKLKEVNVPDGVTTIEGSAFMFCAIKSLVIPASVKEIGKNAFLNTSIKTVYFKGKAPSAGNALFSSKSTTNVLIPKKYASSYSSMKKLNTAVQWSTWNPDGIAAPDIQSIASVSYNSIKITWKKYSGATQFVVQRSKKKSSGFETVKTIKNGSATSYTDKKLKTGTTYYYRIKAYIGLKVTEYTAAYKVVPIPAQSSYANSYRTSTPYKIKVKWKKVAGASGYEILRSSKFNGPYTVVKTVGKKAASATVSGFSHVHNNYKVRAYRIVNGKKVYGPLKYANSIYLNNAGR